MNKTRIEWCDSTWNPVTGCKHGCPYCYARRVAGRFGEAQRATGDHHIFQAPPGSTRYPYGYHPTFHRYRLDEPAHKTKGQTIFVCSMADLFGPWVPIRWIVEVLDACRKAPQHRYLFLTKHPKRYIELEHMALLPHEDIRLSKTQKAMLEYKQRRKASQKAAHEAAPSHHDGNPPW